MAQEVPPNIVVDNGSGWCKAGLSGDDTPSAVIPSVVGTSADQSSDSYVGDKAQSKRDVLNLTYPIERGLVTDWNNMEKLWNYIFYEAIGVAPEKRPVLMTEAPLTPQANREKMTEIMFEKFNAKKFYVTNQPVLSAYAYGRMAGTVVEIGHGATYVVPMADGYAISKAIDRIELGGSDLTDYLSKLLQERGYDLTSPAQKEVVRDMKEKLGYTAASFKAEMAKPSSVLPDKNYELPDGSKVSIGNERFRCAEALFQPSLIGVNSPGVQQRLFDSIMKCDGGIRSKLFSAIVLGGGSSKFTGIEDRLTAEMRKLAPPNSNIKVIARPDRELSAWQGGSHLVILPAFLSMCISRTDYNENGAAIVNKKCV